MEKKKFFNTTLPENLLKRLKMLGVMEGKRINELLAEAIEDLLLKYKSKK